MDRQADKQTTWTHVLIMLRLSKWPSATCLRMRKVLRQCSCLSVTEFMPDRHVYAFRRFVLFSIWEKEKERHRQMDKRTDQLDTRPLIPRPSKWSLILKVTLFLVCFRVCCILYVWKFPVMSVVEIEEQKTDGQTEIQRTSSHALRLSRIKLI